MAASRPAGQGTQTMNGPLPESLDAAYLVAPIGRRLADRRAARLSLATRAVIADGATRKEVAERPAARLRPGSLAEP